MRVGINPAIQNQAVAFGKTMRPFKPLSFAVLAMGLTGDLNIPLYNAQVLAHKHAQELQVQAENAQRQALLTQADTLGANLKKHCEKALDTYHCEFAKAAVQYFSVTNRVQIPSEKALTPQ